MTSKLLLTARLDQRLMMNQKLKQVITFLQYTTLELKQKITELIEENPLIEVLEDQENNEENTENISWDSANYPVSKRKEHAVSMEEDYLYNIASEKTLRDFLIDQTLNCHFDKVEQEIAILIIDALDEDGFLSMEIDELLVHLAENPLTHGKVSVELVLKVLAMLQTFEPVGIAARNTRESLLIQVNIKDDGSDDWRYAREIITTDALAVSGLDLKSIAKITRLNQNQITAGLTALNELDFHPAKSYSGQQEMAIDPELYVKKIGNKWRVFLSNSILTRLNINDQYKKIIKQHTRDKSYKSILNQLQEANLLVSGIRRRNDTLLAVANFIVEEQQAYFDHGDTALRSINLVQVAEAIGYHESTISRITTGKYMATPHGIVELKFFFPSCVDTDNGGAKSSTAIKQMIREIIGSENNGATFSDDDIARLLKEKGIKISRRTVTKYREAMHIESSYQRHHVNDFK